MKSTLTPLAKALAIFLPITIAACGGGGGDGAPTAAGTTKATAAPNAGYTKISDAGGMQATSQSGTVMQVVDGKNQSNFNSTFTNTPTPATPVVNGPSNPHPSTDLTLPNPGKTSDSSASSTRTSDSSSTSSSSSSLTQGTSSKDSASSSATSSTPAKTEPSTASKTGSQASSSSSTSSSTSSSATATKPTQSASQPKSSATSNTPTSSTPATTNTKPNVGSNTSGSKTSSSSASTNTPVKDPVVAPTPKPAEPKPDTTSTSTPGSKASSPQSASSQTSGSQDSTSTATKASETKPASSSKPAVSDGSEPKPTKTPTATPSQGSEKASTTPSVTVATGSDGTRLGTTTTTPSASSSSSSSTTSSSTPTTAPSASNSSSSSAPATPTPQPIIAPSVTTDTTVSTNPSTTTQSEAQIWQQLANKVPANVLNSNFINSKVLSPETSRKLVSQKYGDKYVLADTIVNVDSFTTSTSAVRFDQPITTEASTTSRGLSSNRVSTTSYSTNNSLSATSTALKMARQAEIDNNNRAYKSLNSNFILPFTNATPQALTINANRNTALFTNYLAVADGRLVAEGKTESQSGVDSAKVDNRILTGAGVNVGMIDGHLNADYAGFTNRPIRLDYQGYNSAQSTIVQQDKKPNHGTEVGLIIGGKQEGNVLGLAPKSQLYYIEVPTGNNLLNIYNAMFNNTKNISIVNNSYSLSGLEDNYNYNNFVNNFVEQTKAHPNGPLFIYSSGNQATATRSDGTVVVDSSKRVSSPSKFLSDKADDLDNVIVVTGAKISVPQEQLIQHQRELNQWNALSATAKKYTPKPAIIANYGMIAPTDTAIPCGDTKFSCLTGINFYYFPTDLVNTNVDSGTSFAAPQVTAAAALVKEQFPWMTASNLKTTLLTTASDVGDDGVDSTFGWGLVNYTRALRGPMQFAFGNFTADMGTFKGDYVFSNNIYGSGGLIVKGSTNDSNRLFLTGDNRYQGNTVVDSGSLVVTNGIHSANGGIYVNSRGRLSAPEATLEAGKGVTNNGVFVAHNTSVNGDFTQSPYGLLIVTPDHGLTVTGSAKLSGTLMLNSPSNYVSDSQELHTLVSAGKLEGTKFTQKVTSNFVNYDVYYNYSSNQVLVNIYRKSAQDVAAAIAQGKDNSVMQAAGATLERAMSVVDNVAKINTKHGISSSDLNLQSLPTGDMFSNEYDSKGQIIKVANQGSAVESGDEVDIIKQLIDSGSVRPGTNTHNSDKVVVLKDQDRYGNKDVYAGTGINPLWVSPNHQSHSWQAIQLSSEDLNKSDVVDAAATLDFKDFATPGDNTQLTASQQQEIVDQQKQAQKANAEQSVELSAANLTSTDAKDSSQDVNLTLASDTSKTSAREASDNSTTSTTTELAAANTNSNNSNSSNAAADNTATADNSANPANNANTASTANTDSANTDTANNSNLTEQQATDLAVGKLIENMSASELEQLLYRVSPTAYANALTNQTNIDLTASHEFVRNVLGAKATAYDWQAFVLTKYGQYNWKAAANSPLASDSTSSQTIAGLYRDVNDWRVGVFYGYNKNKWEQGYLKADDSTFDGNGQQVGLSLVYKYHPDFNLGVSATYSHFSNKVQRSIFTSSDITSRFHTNNLTTELFANKEWTIDDRFAVEAYAGLSDYWTRLGSFSENTQANTRLFGLNFTSQDYHQQFANVRLGLKYSFKLFDHPQSLALDVEYARKLADQPLKLHTAEGVEAAASYDNRNQFEARLAHSLQLTKNLALQTSAAYTKASNWQNKNVQVALKFSF